MAPLLTGCVLILAMVIFFAVLFHLNRKTLNKFD